MLFVPSHDPCTRSLEHNPEIYLINMISPEHMCCHQHQNMIKGMIALSKTPKHLWAEAVETACHATNHLYLHKQLGKTTYEVLTGNKPQVGYFRVFGSKCYILDKHRHSKFAPKSHEGFLLSYGSNSHTYRVYNSFTRKVEETVDVKFDESNGSQSNCQLM